MRTAALRRVRDAREGAVPRHHGRGEHRAAFQVPGGGTSRDPGTPPARYDKQYVTTPVDKKWIVSDPCIMMGKPVVAGTRITVELILEKLAAGETVDQILAAHPRLTDEAVRAALAFAADALRADVLYPVEPVAR